MNYFQFLHIVILSNKFYLHIWASKATRQGLHLFSAETKWKNNVMCCLEPYNFIFNALANSCANLTLIWQFLRSQTLRGNYSARNHPELLGSVSASDSFTDLKWNSPMDGCDESNLLLLGVVAFSQSRFSSSTIGLNIPSANNWKISQHLLG